MLWLDVPAGWTTITLTHPESILLPRAGTVRLVKTGNPYTFVGGPEVSDIKLVGSGANFTLPEGAYIGVYADGTVTITYI